MRLGRDSVIGMQNCNVNTYRDGSEAKDVGKKENALQTVFGNTEGSVAQVSDSRVFFPKQVRKESPATQSRARPTPITQPTPRTLVQASVLPVSVTSVAWYASAGHQRASRQTCSSWTA